MNNSVFGKTMQNVEKYVDMKLVGDREKAEKLAAKTNYDRTTIFDENLVAIHMKKKPKYSMTNRFILEWPYSIYLKY